MLTKEQQAFVDYYLNETTTSDFSELNKRRSGRSTAIAHLFTKYENKHVNFVCQYVAQVYVIINVMQKLDPSLQISFDEHLKITTSNNTVIRFSLNDLKLPNSLSFEEDINFTFKKYD